MGIASHVDISKSPGRHCVSSSGVLRIGNSEGTAHSLDMLYGNPRQAPVTNMGGGPPNR